MRKGILAVAPVVLLLVAAFVVAEVYQLKGVKRVDDDLYLAGNVYVQTEYCYHYCYSENAVLIWGGPYSSGNKIIWQNSSKCAVKSVFKR